MIKRNAAGFTIIELLIATAVFSVVLLTISGAIIQMGRIYYRGVTNAHVQETTRSLMNNIAQAIQLSPGQITVPPANTNRGSQAICIDNKQFSFLLGQQQKSNQHSIVINTVNGGCIGAPAQDLTAGGVAGTELLGESMRLSNLTVQEVPASPGTYQVTIRVVYGDDDLLCSDNEHFSCTSPATMSAAQIAGATDLNCKDLRSGSQFCSAAQLSTTVERRLSK